MKRHILSRLYRQVKKLDPLVIYLMVIGAGEIVGRLLAYVRINYGGASKTLGQLAVNTDFPSTIPREYESSRFSFGLHYFGDFLEPFLKSDLGFPYAKASQNGFGVSNYPPLGQALFWPFQFLPYHFAVLLYLLLSISVVVIPCWLLINHLSKTKRIAFVAIGIILSYPMLFTLDRGNFTGFAVGSLLFAALAYTKNNFRTFGVFVAIAASLKLTPVILLLVLIKKRHWFDFFIATVTGLFLSCFSMFLFEGGFFRNWESFINVLGSVHGNLNDQGSYRGINNSPMALFQNLRGLSFQPFHYLGGILETNFVFVISALAVGLLLAIFYSSDSNETSIMMTTGLVTISGLILPVNFTYGLLFYLAPLCLITHWQSKTAESYAIVGLIGLMFINKSPFSPVGAMITGQSLVNSSLQLMVLFVCIRGLTTGSLKQKI